MDDKPDRGADRRNETRSPQSGPVRILFADPNPIMVEAELIEVSERGFRAAHDSRILTPGLEVQYARAGSTGRARVIWTHVLADRCVSGFLILQ
jgi:hypothetical protein